jgi:hypothetical protein
VRAALAVREAPASDRWNHKNLIAILESVLLVAEKANVFFVHVEVDKAAHLSLLVAEMRLQRRKSRFDLSDQLRQVAGIRLDLAGSVGVLMESVWQQDSNGH